jgi:hypothetical protein
MYCSLVHVRDEQASMKAYDIISDTGSLTVGAVSFGRHPCTNIIYSLVRELFLEDGGLDILDKDITN